MYLLGPNNLQIWTDSNRNFTLRQYGRLEYGSPDVRWIVRAAEASRPTPTRRGKHSLATRLRYFVNSFRGFAALDVHGHDDTVRD